MSRSGLNPQEVDRLLAIGRDLSRVSELEPYLQSIVELACSLTCSEASSISIYEAETGLLKFVAAPANHQEALKLIRVPLEASVAGQCFAQALPVIVQDAQSDPSHFNGVDRDLKFTTRSILAVPLIFRSETIGVLEALNKEADDNYTEVDVKILETLASLAATALSYTQMQENATRGANEMAELDQMKANFIAIASHEMRTPLGIVMGHVMEIQENAQNAAERRRADIILSNATRMKKIIEDLTEIDEFSQGKSRFKGQFVAMDELIKEVMDSFAEEARQKKIRLTSKVPDRDLTIVGDTEKIMIALSSLVKNALTFTNENGTVLVLAEYLPGYIKVSVIDNGIGIPPKDIPRVFERFYQVASHMTRRHGGMGLGLAVAKIMIEMHGGQIWVESIEGKGSNFSFLLPSGKSRENTRPRALTQNQ
jgi:signal transduction histidine kinase